MWRAVRDQKCNGASSSATTRGPSSPLVRLPANSSSTTSVSADAETYFLQTTSCQNSKRSDGFLSAVVKLCFTQRCLRSRGVHTDVILKQTLCHDLTQGGYVKEAPKRASVEPTPKAQAPRLQHIKTSEVFPVSGSFERGCGCVDRLLIEM